MPVRTLKYNMRVKAPPNKHKQLEKGMFWCLFVHRSTRCEKTHHPININNLKKVCFAAYLYTEVQDESKSITQ